MTDKELILSERDREYLLRILLFYINSKTDVMGNCRGGVDVDFARNLIKEIENKGY